MRKLKEEEGVGVGEERGERVDGRRVSLPRFDVTYVVYS